MNQTITLSEEVLKSLKVDRVRVSYEKKKIATWNEYFKIILNVLNQKEE